MDNTGINSPNDQSMSVPPAGPMQSAPEPAQPTPEPAQQAPEQVQSTESMQTAPEEQTPSRPEMTYPFKAPGMSPNKRFLIIGAIIIVLIAAGLYLYSSGTPTNPHTTTTVSSSPGILMGCTDIKAPGNYLIDANIRTSIQAGACMNVTASNVHIMCSEGVITGSGPYSGVPPFTYGIAVRGASNVSISGCIIRNFSYGIYSDSSSDLTIHDNNLTTNYLSNIYLNGTRNSSVYSNLMTGSASTEGSLFLSGNSTGNRIYNNTILRNQYYGVNVNSTGNTFLNNYVNGSMTSFYCSIGNGFKGSNVGVGNMCSKSTGCSFMRCKGTNIPVDLSQIKLGSSIDSCGAITLPGHYALTGSINMGSLVNISADIQYNLQCINITSSDVSLDCRNFSIYNSTAGIAAYNESNVSISNCNVRDSNSGITLAGIKASSVSNATMRNDITGLMLTNSSGDMLSNVKAYSGTYGTYLLSSSSDTFQDFNFSGNLYGIYIDHSIGETFSNGAAINNLQDDVYATPDSANTGYSLMLSSSCGLTNANWASCSQHSVANLSNYPLTRCSAISRPGNYTLTSNIVNVPSGCVNITASDVSLNCMSHSIIADAPNFAAGFYVANEKNVSINNCDTLNFRTGVEARSSSNVRVTGSSLISGHYGVAFYNVSNSKVLNNTMAGTFNASILLSNVTNSDISYNNATYGRHESAGILLDNSSGNRLLNNTLFTNYVGMMLEGASVNNLVNNNTAMFSAVHDYSCNDTSIGFNSNYGGIDYGSTKLGCRWMAVLLQSTPQAPCSSFDDQPAQIQLTNDALYRLNATCFDVYTTDTKINCNGHTIIATNNGSFVQFKDSANTGLSNCFLKGFTDPISVINSSAAILNNTILGNATGTAISVIDSALAKVQGNNITYAHRASGPYGIGVSINNSEAGYLLNNLVNGAGTAYLLNNVSSFQITNNTATATDSLGMYLNGSMTNQFYANNFISKTTSLQCKSTSQGSTSNFDNGGTTCTSNVGCAWIKSSALTCHS